MSLADSMQRPGLRLPVGKALAILSLVIVSVLVGAVLMRAMGASSGSGHAATVNSTTGLVVGYAHSQEGAVQAATNYQAMLSDPRMFQATQRHAIVRAIYAPTTQRKFIALYNQVYPATAAGLGAQNGGQMVSRVVPLGWRIDSQSPAANPTNIVVSIWANSVAGSGTTTAQEGWATTTFNLQWVANDWKILDLNTVEGPRPGSGSSQDFLLKIHGLQEYDNAPRATTS